MYKTRFSTSRRLASAAHVLGAALLGVSTLGTIAGCATGMSEAAEENAIVHDVTAAELREAQSRTPIAASGAVLYVNGLGCPLCASNVDKQLKRVPGVADIAVDLSVGRVTLGFKDGPHPSPYILGEAVADAGFTLVKVESR